MLECFPVEPGGNPDPGLDPNPDPDFDFISTQVLDPGPTSGHNQVKNLDPPAGLVWSNKKSLEFQFEFFDQLQNKRAQKWSERQSDDDVRKMIDFLIERLFDPVFYWFHLTWFYTNVYYYWSYDFIAGQQFCW